MLSRKIIFCLVLVSFLCVSFSAQAIEVVFRRDWSEEDTLDAGTPPPGVNFPMVYYVSSQPSKGKAPRYEGHLTIDVQYTMHLDKANDSVSPQFRFPSAYTFNNVEKITCRGDYFCNSPRKRAPAHSWNALSLFMQKLLPNDQYSHAILTMGQQPDPSFIPQFVWNESTKRYECTNLRPGMRVLNFDDLQKSPVGTIEEQKP